MVNTVGGFLRARPSFNWSIEPDETVFRALEIMAEKDVGALLVLEKGRLVGIFTERDYARKIILKGRTSRETLVRDLMTSPVICITPQTTIEQAMVIMTEKSFRHLPVMENDALVGIITIRDLVKEKLSHQEILITDLENYITGSGYSVRREPRQP